LKNLFICIKGRFFIKASDRVGHREDGLQIIIYN